ncbi:MAG: metal-dependent transcriptional regulator [Sphaerochaetaceae bacterium]|nr:metal-dependent transcriptional regulator [Sphaerochaetaceae bacterium]
MYLETILMLSEKQGKVRAIDIANAMDFSKPSVSRALGILRSSDFITIDNGGLITLTEKGETLAKKIYDRHKVLSNMLTSLGVSEITAQADACKIEHDISDETFEAILNHIKGKKD